MVDVRPQGHCDGRPYPPVRARPRHFPRVDLQQVRLGGLLPRQPGRCAGGTGEDRRSNLHPDLWRRAQSDDQPLAEHLPGQADDGQRMLEWTGGEGTLARRSEVSEPRRQRMVEDQR
ncbi:hypothetical protein SAMN05444392_10471 [Seinonella peptonophila]|uniref:Uncharacterized protein n=1 Tax=Seinonella peptonophila TaxID=112248 RepID=A0A1M4X152_9BACL|nr:hypothetical protein SAMN05444392_10471 [Seinonella peptonophila]